MIFQPDSKPGMFRYLLSKPATWARPFPVRDLEDPPFVGEGPKIPQFANDAIDMDDGETTRVGQVDLGDRDHGAPDVDRLQSDQLFTDDAGNARKRGSPAYVEQSFPKDARFKHRCAPEGEAKIWMLR